MTLLCAGFIGRSTAFGRSRGGGFGWVRAGPEPSPSSPDTRRRGASLARLKARYRAHGWLPAEDELPDFLPLMLEARNPDDGTALLAEHRPAIEVLRFALEAHRSPYTDLVRAVCRSLPGNSPAGREEAAALARTGPPAETVGLDAFPSPTHPHRQGPRQ